MALPDDYVEPISSESAESRRLANLKPFQPGQSGNPKGREVGSLNRSTIVKKWLEVQAKGEDGIELPNYDHITLAAIQKAKTGDIQAFTALLDNAFGKLTDKQELTGANGEPLQAIVRKVIDPKVIES